MWVKYEPDKPRGEKICFGQVILDGWTDGLITTGRPLFSTMEYTKEPMAFSANFINSFQKSFLIKKAHEGK